MRGLLDLVQRDSIADQRHVAVALVDRRLNDGVGQAEYRPAADVSWCATRFAAPSSLPLITHSSDRPEAVSAGDVHIVRRAPHQSNRIFADPLQPLVPFLQDPALERGIMWLTLIGSPVSVSGIRQISAALMLQIEDLGKRMRRAGEGAGWVTGIAPPARPRPRPRAIIRPRRNCAPLRAAMIVRRKRNPERCLGSWGH